jgi:quercetin dioxygenase-like cupin family protein
LSIAFLIEKIPGVVHMIQRYLDDEETVRNFAILSVLVLVQFSCATEQANHDSISFKELVRTSKSWDGESLVPYPQGQPEITILRITITAGARLETHSHPLINAGVLVSGQLTVKTTDGKVLRLKAGDPIIEVVDTLHYGINEGTIAAEIVVFYAGIVGQAVTVSEQR